MGYLVQVTGQPLGADVLDALADYKEAFESTGIDGSPVHYYMCDRTDSLNESLGDMLKKIHDMEVGHDMTSSLHTCSIHQGHVLGSDS